MDKYDQAIAYLTMHPEEIQNAWKDPARHVAGCLFAFISDSGTICRTPKNELCGCLTMIAHNSNQYAIHTGTIDEEFTHQIKQDKRIPYSITQVTAEIFPVFAEWQRKTDIRYNRSI